MKPASIEVMPLSPTPTSTTGSTAGTTAEPKPTSEVIRCKSCELNQFMTQSGNCRRCRKPLREPEVVVEVVKPLQVSVDVHQQPSDNYNIGLALSLLRKSQGLSQRVLAAKLQCPRTYISTLEIGKSDPTIKSLYRLTDALGVSPYFFVRFSQLCAEASR